MAVAQPSYTNVFIPTLTKDLIVDFSRNPKDFLVNMLATTTPVEKPMGYYMRVKPDSQARVNGRSSYLWADGAACPIQTDNMHEFDTVKWFTQRVVDSAPLGYQTKENAVYNIESKIVNDLGNKLMLLRAIEFYNVLSNSNNHLSGHIDTATNWGGGKWDVTSGTSRNIQKALQAGVRRILRSTVNGGVKNDDLFLVVGPDVADKMARSAEIADYIRETTDATKYIEFGLWTDQFARYGLPQRLYGINVVVDPTIKDETKLGQTSNKQFLPGASTAYLITRQGGIKSLLGTGNFSSVHFFVDKQWEMKAETIDEPVNARTLLRITDSWDCQLVTREATVVFTECVD